MPQYQDSNGVPTNGVLGGLSVAEQTQDYILAVKEVTSTTPEIINQTQYAIEFIVDKDGGVRTPNQDDETNADIIQNFPIGKNVVSQLVNATSANTQLSGELNVTGVGTIRNILYSQTGIPSSSFSTGSVVFIEPNGAPSEASNPIPNVLGSMISSSAVTISSNSNLNISNYDVTLQSGEGNFTGSSGHYEIASGDLANFNSITFRISATITTTVPTEVRVALFQEGNNIPIEEKTLTVGGLRSPSPSTIFFTKTKNADDISGYYYVNIRTYGSNITASNINFSVISSDPSPTANIPAGNFWSTGSDSTITYLTASAYLSLNYGNLQDTSNFTAATKTFGLDPINTTFELQKGDKIRFGYTPSNTFTIYDVITPSEASDGLLKVKLNKQVPNNIVPDNFIVYRIDPNSPKYIILDINKTSVLGDPENPLKGYIYPKYQSRELKQNIKNIQRTVSQLL